MKQFVTILAGLALVATPAMADFFIPGNFNGWDNTTPMTETSAGSGIWTYDVPTQSAGDGLLMDILSESGNWDSKVYGSGNQWAVADAAGTNTITLDANVYADGWYPVENRVGVAYEANTSWTAVGNWQHLIAGGGDWTNNHPGTLMTDQGGGIYLYETNLLPAGGYEYKAVVTGSWDSIGGNSRNVNSDNFGFTVDNDFDTVKFYVDVLAGTLKVDVVPEPASLSLLALGALALIRRR